MSYDRLTDHELIERWRELARGPWREKRTLHDELARRVAAAGRIVHGEYLYLPSDDDSFFRERNGSAYTQSEATRLRMGRLAELSTDDPARRSGRATG